MAPLIKVRRAYGVVVEGEALISSEGFSPRYDLDRWTGLISRPGHALEGHNLKDKMLITPSAKGGIAAGWAFYDIKHKGIAPKAFVFGVTNPVHGARRGVRRHHDYRRLVADPSRLDKNRRHRARRSG